MSVGVKIKKEKNKGIFLHVYFILQHYRKDQNGPGKAGWCSPRVYIDTSGASGCILIYVSWETRPGVLIIQTALNPDLLFPMNEKREMEGQAA